MLVLPFTEDTLAEALSNKHTSPSTIKNKHHFAYFLKYLSSDEIDAKTIVIEEDYISKDFLYDYTPYYSLCFEGYSKVCRRIHFFSLKFERETFEQMLKGVYQPINIPSSYLGFIVVKPIPFTVIGYTLLKTYAGSPGDRHFWGTKQHVIHLFGVRLYAESLAFQEQDSVVAACATTAIWSMLSNAVHHHVAVVKTPSEITKDASNLSTDGSRLFPNVGLDIIQICEAINKSGLVTEVKAGDVEIPAELQIKGTPLKKIVSKSYLKKLLNAYSPIGIPIILIVVVPSKKKNEISYGSHAITVSGYKQPRPTGANRY